MSMTLSLYYLRKIRLTAVEKEKKLILERGKGENEGDALTTKKKIKGGELFGENVIFLTNYPSKLTALI